MEYDFKTMRAMAFSQMHANEELLREGKADIDKDYYIFAGYVAAYLALGLISTEEFSAHIKTLADIATEKEITFEE